jgi:hypothetical protein
MENDRSPLGSKKANDDSKRVLLFHSKSSDALSHRKFRTVRTEQQRHDPSCHRIMMTPPCRISAIWFILRFKGPGEHSHIVECDEIYDVIKIAAVE